MVEAKSPYDVAAALAERGFRVFPLIPGLKLPASEGWQAIASADPEQVRTQSWQTNSGIGIATGNGLIVFDDDNDRKGGTPLRGLFPLPDTLTVRTARGGLHYYFHAPDTQRYGNPSPLPGIDIRADGGLVVAPGTETPDGAYEIICDVPIAPLPDELRPLLRIAGERKAPGAEVPREDQPGAVDAATRWLNSDRCYTAVEGNRDNTGFKVSAKLYNFGCGYDTVREFLEEWNATKCFPPLNDEDLDRLAGSGFKSSEGGFGRDNPGNVYDVRPTAEQLQAPRLTLQDFGIAPAEPRPDTIEDVSQSDRILSRIKPLKFSLAGLRDIPPTPWMIEDLILRGSAAIFAAPGGTGKSLFTINAALALGMGDGRRFGLSVRCQAKTLIVNHEDDEGTLKRRIGAACMAHGVPEEIVNENLRFFDRHTRPATRMSLAVRNPRTREIERCPDVQAIIAYARSNGIGAIILDPLASLHSASENSNDEMQAVMGILSDIAADADVGVLAVHHSGKGSEAGSDAAIRGASAIVSSSRVARTLHVMTAGDKVTSVRSDDYWRYVRLDTSKTNHGPKTATMWFRKQSIRLPNGEDAPALVPHAFEVPKCDPVLMAAVFRAIVERIAKGKHVPVTERSSGESAGSGAIRAELRDSVHAATSADVIKEALACLEGHGHVSQAPAIPDLGKDGKQKSKLQKGKRVPKNKVPLRWEPTQRGLQAFGSGSGPPS